MHKFAAHRHIVVDHKITTIRPTTNFSSTKIAPIQVKDLFFGLHVVSDRKTAPFLGEDLFLFFWSSPNFGHKTFGDTYQWSHIQLI